MSITAGSAAGDTRTASDTKLLKKHPVIVNRAYLPTPPIKRAYLELAEAIAEYDPGVSFVAYSRFGKTFAIAVLAAELSAAFPEVPMLCVNSVFHPRYIEPTFLSELYESCAGAPLPFSIKGRAIRSKLVKYLWTLAESRNSDRIVMFVDEAQNWNELELTMLRDISNDLELQANITLIVNLIGTPSLVNIRSALLQSGRTDLVGRFMLKQFELEGIGSVREFAETAACYDDVDVSEYPAGSGVSYSAFFMPLAFGAGWRLKDEADLAWETFIEVARPIGFKQIGMKWIARSIKRFLLTECDADCVGFRGTDEMWKAAIMASGFVQTLGVTYSSGARLAAALPGINVPESAAYIDSDEK